MTRRTAIMLAAVLIAGGGLAWAHEGHVHTVMGTVTASQQNHLEVKTNEGKTVSITLNDKTTVVRGSEKLTIASLAAGQRVVVDVGDGKTPLVARQVKLGAAKAAAASK